jgi:hypothetical protein
MHEAFWNGLFGVRWEEAPLGAEAIRLTVRLRERGYAERTCRDYGHAVVHLGRFLHEERGSDQVRNDEVVTDFLVIPTDHGGPSFESPSMHPVRKLVSTGRANELTSFPQVRQPLLWSWGGPPAAAQWQARDPQRPGSQSQYLHEDQQLPLPARPGVQPPMRMPTATGPPVACPASICRPARPASCPAVRRARCLATASGLQL